MTSSPPSKPTKSSAGAEALIRTWRERDELIARLDAEGADDLADKLRGCGQPLNLVCTCCGEIKTVKTRCKRKWCPTCARSIAAKRVSRYNAAVDAMQWPLFVTLTVPNTADLEISAIKGLRRAYGKMKLQGWWQRAVLGGVTSVEITNIGNGWHPHLHSVIDCRWLAVKTPPPKPFESRKALLARFKAAGKEVAARWAKCNGVPQANIDIKRAYSDRRLPEEGKVSDTIAREVLKYSVKASDLLKCVEPIAPLINLLDRCRLVSSFGSCYGSRLTVPDDMRMPTECDKCHARGGMMLESTVDKLISIQAHESHRRDPRR
jgi:hypothetical protein